MAGNLEGMLSPILTTRSVGPQRPRRVLLIEDNPGDVRLFREALAGAGDGQFELETASRLSQGVRRLSKGGVDVVVLDLYLPDGRPAQILRRAGEQIVDVPVVVLTGVRDEATAVRAFYEGTADYLVKGSVRGAELVRCLDRVIEHHRLPTESRM